jgi:hypothetical protein
VTRGLALNASCLAPRQPESADRRHRDGSYPLTGGEGTVGEWTSLLTDAAVAALDSGEEAIDQRTLMLASYAGSTQRRRLIERELA